MNRLDLLLTQFDGLVVFLAAAHGEVFQLIRANELTWFPFSQNPEVPETAEAYQTAVCNSAFLLGYSYLEAFLGDVIRQVYARRPKMLPGGKEIKYKELLAAASKEDLLYQLVEREVRSVFAGSIEDVKRHFEEKLGVTWPDEPRIMVASRIRNCLMHNDARADDRLAASVPLDLPVGTRIRLRPAEVHEYGIAARQFATGLWNATSGRHFGES